MHTSSFFSEKLILFLCFNLQDGAKHIFQLFPAHIIIIQISLYHNLISCVIFIDPNCHWSFRNQSIARTSTAPLCCFYMLS